MPKLFYRLDSKDQARVLNEEDGSDIPMNVFLQFLNTTDILNSEIDYVIGSDQRTIISVKTAELLGLKTDGVIFEDFVYEDQKKMKNNNEEMAFFLVETSSLSDETLLIRAHNKFEAIDLAKNHMALVDKKADPLGFGIHLKCKEISFDDCRFISRILKTGSMYKY